MTMMGMFITCMNDDYVEDFHSIIIKLLLIFNLNSYLIYEHPPKRYKNQLFST